MKSKDNSVFNISLLVVFSIVLWGLIFPNSFEVSFNALYEVLVTNVGWFYMIVMFALVVFAIWIAFSKYGKIKLGDDNSEPEHSNISWFAMLFSAGMGIGLVFWGVAEPLNHYVSPLSAEGGTVEAAQFAFNKSFFHWGFHPWAAYSVLALALAYMQFRKKKPAIISSIFIPLIGEERARGPIGKTIDILAIFATVTGVATSLGLGTLQINSGLNHMFNVPENNLSQVLIVVIVTILFMMSALTGLNKGIKILSNTNVILAGIILLSAFVLGPTILITNTFTQEVGSYIGSFIQDSFHLSAHEDTSWFGNWTIFYWAWWIAWAPFVGTFIARISKGRTIKEFVLGVLIAPAMVSFFWFTTFGTLGIELGPEIAATAIESTSTAFFVVMESYPLGTLISLVAVLLLCTFFITSADSATFVLGMMSSNGALTPSNQKKVLWGVIQSLLALSLMLVGGLEMLQTAAIVAAFPFAIILAIAMYSLYVAVKSDEVVAKTKTVDQKQMKEVVKWYKKMKNNGGLPDNSMDLQKSILEDPGSELKGSQGKTIEKESEKSNPLESPDVKERKDSKIVDVNLTSQEA